MTHRLRLPSPALAISLISLFVALGGTSYALSSLPANSVGAKQLKKNAVTTKKIKNGAVTSGKVADGAITNGKVADGAITASKINPSGLTVPKATIGESPIAWADVGAAGGFINGRGMTGASVSLHGTSFYCFKGLSFPVKSATVVPDYGVDETPTVGAGVSIPASDTGDCPSGSQVEVATWLSSGLSPQSFYIQFFN